MAPPRYPSNPNTVKINFDFDTMDALRAEAKRRKIAAVDRCAYELIQEGLALRSRTSIATPEPQPDDHLDQAMRNGLAAITNRPKGTA